LGFPIERRPLLIAIDGEDGSGKSSFAAWLSWQFEMPAIHLDVFLIRDSDPIAWRSTELRATLDGAQFVPPKRPVIIEGVLVRNALSAIDRVPDFSIFIERDSHSGNMQQELSSYIQQAKPKADYILRWSSKEYDARVRDAHLAQASP
jgi:uridine kinase